MKTWEGITILIPTVPSRRTALGQLIERLDPCLKTGADLRIVMSLGKRPKDDVLQLLQEAESGIMPWILYLQDDAWPAPTFADAIPDLLGEAPFHVISFFSRRRGFQERDRFHRVTRNDLWSAVCLAFPQDFLIGLSLWAEEWYEANPDTVMAFDRLIAAWASWTRKTVGVWSPSLVQHRDGKSCFAGRSSARRSESFLRAFGPVPPLPSEDP